MHNLNLLYIPTQDVPAATQPRVKLLSFGTNPVELSLEPPKRSSIRTLKSELEKIKQGSAPPAPAAKMQFLEVTDISEPREVPLQTFVETKPSELLNKASDLLEPAPASEPVEQFGQTEPLQPEDLEFSEADPNYDYMRTHEHHVQDMNEQLAQLERIAANLEAGMNDSKLVLEEINKKYEDQVEAAKKRTALKMLRSMEEKVELSYVTDERSEVEKLLASNKGLYEDIDRSFSKPKHEPPVRESAPKFYQKPLAPAVIPKPQTLKKKQSNPAKVTHRMTRAMEAAAEAIRFIRK